MIRAALLPDAWLAERLGKACFSLHQDPEGAGIDELLREKRTEPCFIQARAPLAENAFLRALLARSFMLADTCITFTRRAPALAGVFSVREARPEDREEVASLAGKVFRWTRFHQDPHIPESAADAIQRDWAENFFRGARGDAMFVAERDGRIAGFNLVLRKEPDTMIIDSIGLAPEVRGQGLGRALIDMAQKRLGCAMAQAGTQLANLPAIGFYQKAGFLLSAAHYTLHLHTGPAGNDIFVK